MASFFALVLTLGLQAALLIGAQNAHADGEPVIGTFRATYYNLTLESQYAGQPSSAILDTRGNTIAMVKPGFKTQLDINGTGRLDDGRIVNYAGGGAYDIRYIVTDSPYGIGVNNCNLVPFHTIAVDRRYIAIGTVVRIDETQGMVLPDGSIHNGLWVAEDAGGAINGDHIDLYIGDSTDANVAALRKAVPYHMQRLTVRLVQRPQPGGCSTLSKSVEVIRKDNTDVLGGGR